MEAKKVRSSVLARTVRLAGKTALTSETLLEVQCLALML